ncbi:hypothetical protein Tco_1507710 [Tanacetum coccineum]
MRYHRPRITAELSVNSKAVPRCSRALELTAHETSRLASMYELVVDESIIVCNDLLLAVPAPMVALARHEDPDHG